MEFAYAEPRELLPGVSRIVANNPGPFTFKGTNTYIIGRESLAVIDPGPDDAAHRQAILAAAAGRPITHIILTHTHFDHYEGLPELQKATGARTAGYGAERRSQGMRRHKKAETGDVSFRPDVVLRDGDRLESEEWALEAVFTPGHAPDHLCFALAGTRALFSGDHVMSWNTSVVAPPEGNMSDYMASLEKLLLRDDGILLPGHGGQLGSPEKLVRAFLVHRRMREQAVMQAIRQGMASIPDITDAVYRGLDSRLVDAARASVLAHVERLVALGQVRSEGPASDPRLQAAGA
ncbi:MAG: MBL fold metallo-hydrolase [Hyphomicrobiaceae bacterium]|nr:MAG: MBL fold metallo-hydrolase [Hyphomicrobiaceae bacterium]